MSKSDWLEVGLKLLGTYFVVAGTLALWRVLLTTLFACAGAIESGSPFLASMGGKSATAGAIALALLLPLGEVVVGLVLLFVKWPLPAVRSRQSGEDVVAEALRRMESDKGPHLD